MFLNPKPSNQVRLCMIVECNGALEYDSAKEGEGLRLIQRKESQTELIDFEIPGAIPVYGDVHVRFFIFEVRLGLLEPPNFSPAEFLAPRWFVQCFSFNSPDFRGAKGGGSLGRWFDRAPSIPTSRP